MNGVEILPSLLSADFSRMGQEIEIWDQLDVQGFHLDVMDGHFVPNLTFGPDFIAALRSYTTKLFDVHLMIEKPEMFIERFIEAGANRISFHIELPANPLPFIKRIKNFGVAAGLAINPSTAVEVLWPYLDQIDFVLLMTVQPGFSGGKFVPKALEKIPDILAQKPAMKITVDGAMGPDTVALAISKGANQIVSGSKLFKGGSRFYAQNIENLRRHLVLG
jgi:ribulose-phosphate 3-epimerase